MEKVMFASGIVGIMVIGAMSKDMFYATIPLEIGASVSGEEVQTVQGILDGIMPGVLGLSATWIYYWLLKKKSKSYVVDIWNYDSGYCWCLLRFPGIIY